MVKIVKRTCILTGDCPVQLTFQCLLALLIFQGILSSGTCICDRIWEKGALRAFPESWFQNAYISETLAAMNFKLGMNIIFFHHPTTLAINRGPRPLPVWAGRVPTSITFENCRSMPLFGGSPLRTGGLLKVLTLDPWSRRSKLLTNQVWSPKFSLPWNGGKLKSYKKSRFAQSAPFPQIQSHISEFKRP